MSGDEENKIEGWISKLNLPQIILGRAGAALSEIVGSAVDIPKAGVERVSAKIRAETDRQIQFDDQIHKKATELALTDDAFIARALDSNAKRLLKGQYNRERIARVALNDLEEGGVEDARLDEEKVSEDWLNYFSGYAEKVSSLEMQEFWGKLLAGEIRKPGQFSLSTMRILAETDAETAKKFVDKVDHNLGGAFIYEKPDSGTLDPDLTHLENAGFIKGINAIGLSKTFHSKQHGGFSTFYESHIFKINCNEECKKLSLPVLLLTRAGADVLTLVQNQTPLKLAQRIINVCPKDAKNIEVYSAKEKSNGQWQSVRLIGQFKKEN